MQNTGIVRKIDDLGRIVLPKELRKTFNINSGDDFQIAIDNERIILEKFSKLESYEDTILKIINCFSCVTNYTIYVTINDEIINNKLKVSNIISNIIKSRKIYINERIDKNILNNSLIVEGKMIILPIVINSDLMGSIIIIGNDYIKVLESYAKIIYNLIKKIIVNA